jgi:hypothetical protein
MLKQSAAHEFVRMTAAEPGWWVSTPTTFRRRMWRAYKGRPAQPSSKPPPAPPKQAPAPSPSTPKPEAPQPSPPPKEGH